MSQMYFIGVDISKSKLDLAVIDQNFKIVLEKIIPNKPDRINGFLKSLGKKLKVSSDQFLVCCESTGIYGRPLEQVCSGEQIFLWTENAFKIKKASSDMRGKSDVKDARRIADYALRYKDKAIAYQEPGESTRKMKTLLHLRESLMSQATGMKNQLREAKSHDAQLYKLLQKSMSPVLKTLDAELKKIEDELNQVVGNQPEIQENLRLLKTIPGIGKQNALYFIVQTENFKRFRSAKHLACYAGVVPFPNQSGTMVRRDKVSKFANQTLKKLIHLAAMSATRVKGELQNYFIRKVKEGKNKMAVINAIRNKLIHRMFSVISRQCEYVDYIAVLSNKLDN